MKKVMMAVAMLMLTQVTMAYGPDIQTAAGNSYYAINSHILQTGPMRVSSMYIYGQALYKPADFSYDIKKIVIADEATAQKQFVIVFSDDSTMTVVNPYMVDEKLLKSGIINFKDADMVVYKNGGGQSYFFTRPSVNNQAAALVLEP